MPSYNHREYIEEAIESVLAQDVSLELLIQDDCSTDDTWDLIRKIRDPRVQAVQSPRNRASHPRNFARHRVQGRFIAFLNSDDRWLPGKLKAQLEGLKRLPQSTVSFTSARFIGPDVPAADMDWFLACEIPSPDWLLQLFFSEGNRVCLTSAVIPTAFLNRLGWFHPALLQVGDWDLWIRALLRADAVVNIPEVFTEMRHLGARNLSRDPAMTLRVQGEYFTALDSFLSRLALRRFRPIFDPQKTIDLPRIPVAPKQIVITRLAMQARCGLSRIWGVYRYQALLRRPGYARLCRAMFGREAVEDYDLVSRQRKESPQLAER